MLIVFIVPRDPLALTVPLVGAGGRLLASAPSVAVRRAARAVLRHVTALAVVAGDRAELRRGNSSHAHQYGGGTRIECFMIMNLLLVFYL